MVGINGRPPRTASYNACAPPRLVPLPAISLPIYFVVIISRLSRSPTETSSRIHKFLGRIRGILQQQIPEIFSPKIFQIFVPYVRLLFSFTTSSRFFYSLLPFLFFLISPPAHSRSLAEHIFKDGRNECLFLRQAEFTA